MKLTNNLRAIVAVICSLQVLYVSATSSIIDTTKKKVPIDTLFGGRLSFANAFPPPNKSIAINIQQKGVRPSYSAEENTKAIEKLINDLPEAATIYAPAGDYRFAKAINLHKKGIHFFGDNGSLWVKGTHFYFPKESQGLILLGPAIIENIGLIGSGNQNEWMDGVVIRSVVKLNGVFVKGFYHGIEGFGDIEGTKFNISGSSIVNCFAAENTKDGFFFGRVDGNAVTVIGCDSRDNGRYGFNDDSFLGNYFFGCMAHNNKGGHYYVRDKLNARSAFIGCYGEMDSPVNDFSRLTTVIGGFLANGYNKYDGKGVIKQ
jgi:hypothetical protein